MESIKVAALQLDLAWHNPAANREKIARMLSAAKVRPDIILLPEMFTTGFTMKPAQVAEEVEGTTMEWMMGLAQKYHALVGGSLVIREGKNYFNRFLFVDEEDIQLEYNKRHLFRLGGEDKPYQKGEEWVWYEYNGWKMVPLICYDLRFPVWSRNRAQADGQLRHDILMYVANWPGKRIGHWETLLRARAIENQSYVIGVNRIGKDENGLEYPGHTMIVDPHGEVLAFNKGEETLVTAELHRNVLLDWRKEFPVWLDADEFDLYM
ncbi:MAG: amidohydrolase [Bacteroidia bacterium]